MKLFSESYDQSEVRKIPSLSEYQKANPPSKRPKAFLVTVFWLPRRYPSYTIETEAWRANVPKDSALGKAIEELVDSIDKIETDVLCSFEKEKGKPLSFSFKQGKGKGYWKAIRPDEPLGMKYESL